MAPLELFWTRIFALYCPIFFQYFVLGIHSPEVLQRIEDNLSPHCPPNDMRNISVHVYLDLYKILGVDERNGVASFKLHEYIYYYSPSIVWTASENDGSLLMFFEEGTYWTPDICKFCFSRFNSGLFIQLEDRCC